jgi:hypothetical protein
MKFEEVLPALRAGKKVQHKDWKSKLDFSISLESTPSTLLILGEVLSNDWEIVKDKVKKTVWVNVYQGQHGFATDGIHNSQEEALHSAARIGMPHICLHSFTVEVGEE